MPVGSGWAQPAKPMAKRKVGRAGSQLVGYRARLVCQSDDAYCVFTQEFVHGMHRQVRRRHEEGQTARRAPGHAPWVGWWGRTRGTVLGISE